MASERQRGASRRNGSEGGPSTEAGKQRSRLNTIKHGLTSTTLVVLPEEHQHEYEEVLRGFRESFQPHDAAEDALVLRLAQAHWRSLRSRRVETGILNITAATERARARKLVEDCPEHLSPHNAIAVGFMTNPEERWRMYLRYDGAISRDFFRTLDTLMRLQRARQRTSTDPKPLVATAASGAPLSDSGIRSVSQISSTPSDHNNHKGLTHESQNQNQDEPRRTLRSPRRIASPTAGTSGFRKERNLRRLSAAARGLPRSQRRTSEGHSRHLGRPRQRRNRIATAVNPSHSQNISPRVDIE